MPPFRFTDLQMLGSTRNRARAGILDLKEIGVNENFGQQQGSCTAAKDW